MRDREAFERAEQRRQERLEARQMIYARLQKRAVQEGGFLADNLEDIMKLADLRDVAGRGRR